MKMDKKLIFCEVFLTQNPVNISSRSANASLCSNDQDIVLAVSKFLLTLFGRFEETAYKKIIYVLLSLLLYQKSDITN